jgi:hypothetical protein
MTIIEFEYLIIFAWSNKDILLVVTIENQYYF